MPASYSEKILKYQHVHDAVGTAHSTWEFETNKGLVASFKIPAELVDDAEHLHKIYLLVEENINNVIARDL